MSDETPIVMNNDGIKARSLKETMETSYIEYAMSVIAARALPDARDGMKPVQRRILYAMKELNNTPDKPHRKCARIVGDTMGKYHPHGDSSIYGALVNMAQEWSLRYPLVDGHGNFGSIDGDGAAAMRYTEARLSKISMEMIADIDKDTVDFIPNFDETEKEPTVLPARFPNLLVNGTTGIAVGMATNIPPHNMGETIDAVIKIIDDKTEGVETTVEDLMDIVKGPDFPTGAVILGRRGIEQAYRTGRGKIIVRAVSNIETLKNGKNMIVITELPYLVNKAKLIEKIAELVKDKRIDGITDLRDESDKDGMRVCIELRKDANANVILNQLYKHTQLQDTFGVIMLALVNNEPRVLNLKEMLSVYLRHQEEVITRRTQFELKKAEERAHILEGLLTAIGNIDEVIKIIRGAESVAVAREQLTLRFGLDDVQTQAIVDMRLRALTGLERGKLEEELAGLRIKIQYYKDILADEKKLLGVIKDELTVIKNKYGDLRKTQFGIDDDEFTDEDLIPDDVSVIARTRLGYVKRMSLDNFKLQNRGGKGIKGMQTLDEDAIEDLFMTTSHHRILFFTTFGRAYCIKGYQIPEASRISRGTAIINLLQLQPEEKITATIDLRSFNDDRYFIMCTKKGIVKRVRIRDFTNIRKTGLNAMDIRDDDRLISVRITDGNQDVILMTEKGQGIRFNETELRVLSRSAMGVKGINLSEDDQVVSMQIASAGEYMLFVTENGYGKLTAVSEYDAHHRHGKGVMSYRINEKTGKLVDMLIIDSNKEILIMTNEGIVIRTAVEQIRVTGRVASGVKLINIDTEAGVSVAGVMEVKEDENAISEMEKQEELLNSEIIEEESEMFEGDDMEMSDGMTDEVSEEENPDEQ